MTPSLLPPPLSSMVPAGGAGQQQDSSHQDGGQGEEQGQGQMGEHGARYTRRTLALARSKKHENKESVRNKIVKKVTNS